MRPFKSVLKQRWKANWMTKHCWISTWIWPLLLSLALSPWKPLLLLSNLSGMLCNNNILFNIIIILIVMLRSQSNVSEAESSSDDVKPASHQFLLLGASGYAHQYCTKINPNCGSAPEYQALVDEIAAVLEQKVSFTFIRFTKCTLQCIHHSTHDSFSTIPEITCWPLLPSTLWEILMHWHLLLWAYWVNC